MVGRRAVPERLATGELEARVMQVLWDADDSLIPAEVNALLPPERPLAYTTVMTILVRLHDKGAVNRERRGRAWAYSPVESRSDHVAKRMAELLRESGDASAALARFLARMSGRERATLRRLLQPPKAGR